MNNITDFSNLSINLHLTEACNYQCGFCFSKYSNKPDQHGPAFTCRNKTDEHFGFTNRPRELSSSNHKPNLDFQSVRKIIHAIAEAGFKKITFAGGEPLLYQGLVELVETAHKFGMTTMLVSNGSLLSEQILQQLQGKIDWIGLSIDSLYPDTNIAIGRADRGRDPITTEGYIALCHNILSLGFRLKINTVVNKLNLHENLSDFVRLVHPERWKIFQVIFNQSVNDKRRQEFEISTDQFWNYFLDNYFTDTGIHIVPECESLMRGSYLMIDPLGRFYDNSSGAYNFSREILDVGIDAALADIKFSPELFIKRGGIYDF